MNNTFENLPTKLMAKIYCERNDEGKFVAKKFYVSFFNTSFGKKFKPDMFTKVNEKGKIIFISNHCSFREMIDHCKTMLHKTV